MAQVASVGAMGLSALSTIMAGQGTNAADQMQAATLDERAQIGQAAATETGAQMTDRLNQTLANLDAVRAAAHDNPSSPTAFAVRGRAQMLGDEEQSIRVGNILMQNQMDTAGASYLRQAGTFALDTSYLKAGGQSLGSLSSMLSFGFGGDDEAAGIGKGD